MKIKWLMNNGLCGCDQSGEIEVDDDTSDDDIEAAVKEDMWNVVSLNWERVQS
jgi:hypothetical protein